MLLSGFSGRMVRQVERPDDCVKILFEDGGYLYDRSKGPGAIVAQNQLHVHEVRAVSM